ncbi:hypothetical protein NKT35_13930 [Chromobacterium sp. IIBBL 290-4]|nr:hypothetical protein [Chromobacterium sp. IIBBL 290-4]UTH72639.1 hypothetical protein NKT35_13930 [Chromobacterium sp. IIBBL 290-4]
MILNNNQVAHTLVNTTLLYSLQWRREACQYLIGHSLESIYQKVQKRPHPGRHIAVLLEYGIDSRLAFDPIRQQDFECTAANIGGGIPDRLARNAMPSQCPPGLPADGRLPIRRVLAIPGVLSVLLVVMSWILPHYILYTYIAPFLASLGLARHVDIVLLVFGMSAMFGIWLVGYLVDRWLRLLVLTGLGAFALVSLIFGLGTRSPVFIFAGVAVWGVSFSGAPTLLQTALADATGNDADVAQSMLVTVFNFAFAGSGLIGGVLLESAGAQIFPWVVLVILMMGFLTAWRANAHGFTPGPRR